MRPGALPQQIRQSLTLVLLVGGFAYWWQAAGLKSVDRYQIAADHTETHAHLAASSTTCPGRMFPSQAILGSRSVALELKTSR